MNQFQKFTNPSGFPGYNPVFPGQPLNTGVWVAPNGQQPQMMIFPQPGYSPYHYANMPGNQWALPGPVGPVANLRNIPQPPVQQFLNQTSKSNGFPGIKDSVTRTVPNLRQPINQNPFMNVPPTAFDAPQIYQDYDRYESTAYPTPKTEAVENKVETDFVKGMFQDPAGKLFERNNSQRQFYSTPVGSVQNDQTEFANWLYGNDRVCKQGSTAMRYGVKFTPDSLHCTGFNSSTPTNFGQLKAD